MNNIQKRLPVILSTQDQETSTAIMYNSSTNTFALYDFDLEKYLRNGESSFDNADEARNNGYVFATLFVIDTDLKPEVGQYVLGGDDQIGQAEYGRNYKGVAIMCSLPELGLPLIPFSFVEQYTQRPQNTIDVTIADVSVQRMIVNDEIVSETPIEIQPETVVETVHHHHTDVIVEEPIFGNNGYSLNEVSDMVANYMVAIDGYRDFYTEKMNFENWFNS